MKVYFITGNENKFREVEKILKDVCDIEKLDIDIPEIQEIDVTKIIKDKIEKAKKNYQGEFIVEDTGLYLNCLKGLPGPLIKWFLKTMGNKGLFKICKKLNNYDAEAKTILGYSNNKKEIKFFQGSIKGKICNPRKSGFGWDPIFIPKEFEKQDKSFSEISSEEKNQISMRRKALEKFKEYIGNSFYSTTPIK